MPAVGMGTCPCHAGSDHVYVELELQNVSSAQWKRLFPGDSADGSHTFRSPSARVPLTLTPPAWDAPASCVCDPTRRPRQTPVSPLPSFHR